MNRLAQAFAWTDDKRNVNRLVWGLGILCVLLGLADFFYHKHVHYAVEEIPGIFGIVGFVVYATVIFIAKGLRLIVKRPEDYYAPHNVETEKEKGAGTVNDGHA